MASKPTEVEPVVATAAAAGADEEKKDETKPTTFDEKFCAEMAKSIEKEYKLLKTGHASLLQLIEVLAARSYTKKDELLKLRNTKDAKLLKKLAFLKPFIEGFEPLVHKFETLYDILKQNGEEEDEDENPELTAQMLTELFQPERFVPFPDMPKANIPVLDLPERELITTIMNRFFWGLDNRLFRYVMGQYKNVEHITEFDPTEKDYKELKFNFRDHVVKWWPALASVAQKLFDEFNTLDEYDPIDVIKTVIEEAKMAKQTAHEALISSSATIPYGAIAAKHQSMTSAEKLQPNLPQFSFKAVLTKTKPEVKKPIEPKPAAPVAPVAPVVPEPKKAPAAKQPIPAPAAPASSPLQIPHPAENKIHQERHVKRRETNKWHVINRTTGATVIPNFDPDDHIFINIETGMSTFFNRFSPQPANVMPHAL
ncbi:MAG: hypothetical protein Hyperionvirus31_21 [Hyperionvirus sp.]|uniref:Uncharacterized protein n=1 Tax=Hyperionvirus sp. TaxID=2487770 RepID=A0A3G5AED5_9VIRU|nr:MAG: hypothetical protein Hyperionvirus31_21 [Hyperionvirus sp.]